MVLGSLLWGLGDCAVLRIQPWSYLHILETQFLNNNDKKVQHKDIETQICIYKVSFVFFTRTANKIYIFHVTDGYGAMV